MEVSDWIRTCREALDMSREQLAAALNCSFESVRIWESGKRAPSAKSMWPLVQLFGVPKALEWNDVLLETHFTVTKTPLSK